MARPYFNSDDIISAVKRKISLPVFQSTFSEEDILAFANEELAVSQVPSVLSFHEEYFVTRLLEGGGTTISLQADKSNYPIPNRAIGLRLRDLFYTDGTNLFEMTRVSSDDRSYFEGGSGITQTIRKFYLEGNDIIIVPSVDSSPVGSLVMVYYLRPNQLVTTDRAAIIDAFTKTITISNASIVAGNTVTINDVIFTAVAAGATGNQFNIGGSSAITATNLATTISNSGNDFTAVASSTVVTVSFEDQDIEMTTTNSTGFSIQTTLGIAFEGTLPTIFQDGENVDFLQTKPGHRSLALSIPIPTGGVSGNTISFTESSIPEDLIVGDYICLENECIIPQIPSDLHINLVERTCARILAAMGDQIGLEATNAKLAEIEQRQGNLLDNRVEGAPQKVLARNSLLRYGKINFYRRF